MSNPQDNLTEQLSRELHQRGATVEGQPIGLGDVKRQAGRIRRRRNLAAGAAVAAVVAIAIPSVMVAGNLFPQASDKNPGPATNSPNPTQDATIEPGGTVVLDADAPQGAAPQLEYLDGDTLVTPSGNRIPLGATYSYLARVGDELLAVRQGDPGTFVDVLDAEGAVVDTSETMAEAVSSADHTVGAWITPSGEILTRFQGRTVPLGDTGGRPAQAVEIQGSGSCMETEGGCRVFFNVLDERSLPAAADSHGIVETVAGGLTNVRAISPDGLLAGLVSKPDPDPAAPACSAVVDEQAGKQLWKTCDYVFEYAGSGFSPDESTIVGYHQDADGAGPRSIVALGARTGEVRLEIEVEGAAGNRPNGTIVDTTWEDDGHLVVKTEGYDEAGIPAYNLWRVGLDGSVERLLVPDKTGGGEVQPWVFLD
jgi:hypothetical protein